MRAGCLLIAAMVLGCLPALAVAAGEAQPAAHGAAAEAEPIRSEEILAIVTHRGGEVSLRGTWGRRPIRMLQTVPDGAFFELGEAAELTLLCGDGGVVQLTASGTLTTERCRQAGRRAPGRLAALVPDGGRLKAWHGSLVLEGETRERPADYGRRPILLSPRCPLPEAHRLGCTRISDLRPTLRWVEVEGATRYEITLDGFDKLVVKAEELACEDDEKIAPYRVCSRAWPASSWQLVAGKSYFLRVEAHLGLFEKTTSEKSKIELVAGAEIGRELAALRGLKLDPSTHSLLAGSLLAERRLYNEAVTLFEEAAAHHDEAILQVALGDAYRRVDLLNPASRRYRSALAELEAAGREPAVEAAAERGLGWAHYRWGFYEHALARFQRARDLYTELGLTVEAASATEMIGKIDARTGELP